MLASLPSLLLFARTPVRGRVKTRLVPPLTPDGALRLYRAFLEDAARGYLAPGSWNAVLAAEPDADDPDLARVFASPWQRLPQSSGDLGDRLTLAFEREFSRGSPAVVAVGSDHPALPRRLIDGAFGRLSGGEDVVLVPADDGGYCVIGLSQRAPVREVFREIPWSTASTLAVTCERARSAGLSVSMLEASYDVDRPEDLARLKSDLASRDPQEADFPRATARVLAEVAP